jgi:hypothetical protein
MRLWCGVRPSVRPGSEGLAAIPRHEQPTPSRARLLHASRREPYLIAAKRMLHVIVSVSGPGSAPGGITQN